MSITESTSHYALPYPEIADALARKRECERQAMWWDLKANLLKLQAEARLALGPLGDHDSRFQRVPDNYPRPTSAPLVRVMAVMRLEGRTVGYMATTGDIIPRGVLLAGR